MSRKKNHNTASKAISLAGLHQSACVTGYSQLRRVTFRLEKLSHSVAGQLMYVMFNG